MSPGAVGTSASLQDVKQLLEQIRKLCGKISVAKKETSQLAELCDSLSNRLGDRSLISQQPNYDDIKSNLVKVEVQLIGWSKLNLPKSLMKRAHIEAGVTGFVEKLEIISQATVNHGIHPSGEGASEDAGTFVTSTKNTRHSVSSGQANEAPYIKRLDGEVTRLRETPLTGGMYCDVWMGQWVKQGGEKGSGEEIGGEKVEVEKVALKALQTESPEKARQILEYELPRWEELRHQNILPFYGIVTDIGPRLYMVSPWQENGNLLVYVKTTPQPNKNYLLRGSAAGLSYLHSRGVVHGSVKCKNVLVSHEGEPQICDFGIARIWEEVNGTTTSKTMTSGGHVRYIALEHIEDNNVPATTYSDIYSFAMLILECITEEVPFSNLTRDAAVLHARTIKGQCPPRPDGQDRKNHVPDDLWELMMRCWAVRPDQRPTMEQVHSFFLHQA